MYKFEAYLFFSTWHLSMNMRTIEVAIRCGLKVWLMESTRILFVDAIGQ